MIDQIKELQKRIDELVNEMVQLKDSNLNLEEDNHAMRERLRDIEKAVQEAAGKAQDLADGIRRI